MAQQTQALSRITNNTQQALDEAQIDPRLLMAAKAIQLMAGTDNNGKPKVSADMALAAAMYQAGTGQLLGRDFYVHDKVGRMEGYRGVARDAVERGVGEVQIKYRPITADEADEHEVQAGDTAVACEVYQLRAWRLAQRMGQTYTPIVGIGIIRKAEKFKTQEWDDSSRRYVQLPENKWRPIALEGGMTWRKKAQNRAYKEALRHAPGVPASSGEVLEEAALAGIPMPPETAHLDIEQAIEWVKQRQEERGPEWDSATEGEFEPETESEQGTNGNGKPALRPGEKVWADWTSADDAKAWAATQRKFNHDKHLENAYEKVRANVVANGSKKADDMWQAWWQYVTDHEPQEANWPTDEKPLFEDGLYGTDQA